MRFITIALSLAASVAAQVDTSGLPSCASSCVDLSQTGCTSKFNVSCICASKQWINYLACCVSQKCDAADQSATIAFAQNICTPVGVTVRTTTGCQNSTSGSNSTSSGSASSATGTHLAVTSSKAGAAPTSFAQYVGNAVGLAAAGALVAML